jgi:inosine-uridine nucleoside N-ribohydrolase
MKKLAFLFILTILSTGTFSQKNIIVDTDCGRDDFNALAFLLAQKEYKIILIIASDGNIAPSSGIKKIQQLLSSFHKNIPVTEGAKTLTEPPTWRNYAEKLKWGKQKVLNKLIDISYISNILDTLKTPLEFICLGSLHSAYTLLSKNPDYLKKVSRIIWYNPINNPQTGFNYKCDTIAARWILENKNIRTDIIFNKNPGVLKFTDTDFNKTNKISIFSEILNRFWQQPAIVKEKHDSIILNDELVVLYLQNPDLFGMTIKFPQKNIRYNQQMNARAIMEAWEDNLCGKYVSSKYIALNYFPNERNIYRYDVRQIKDSAIIKYGEEEWRACVLTDEIHGHLGIFSIIGAKMGIKAREYLNAPIDKIKVISHAGVIPPYSCLNDGLQVSTGATLGQGLIDVPSNTNLKPEAIFSFQNQKILITLKSEFETEINNDISEGIVNFGLSDQGYWLFIRNLAIKYWDNWDRNIIFEIQVLK